MKSTKKCVIQSILNHRQSNSGKIYYLIKWKKFPMSRATWEPLANLIEVQDLVRSYWQDIKPSQNRSWQRVQMNKECLLIYDEQIRQNKSFNENVNKNHIQKQIDMKEINMQVKFNQNGSVLQQKSEKFGIIQTDYLRQKIKFTKKFQNSLKSLKSRSANIDFTQAKKVKMIKFNKFEQKWKVLLEFYDTKGCKDKWVNRQILRMGNPFILLEFYQKLHRLKKTEKWDQLHQLVTEVDYQ